MAPYLESGDLLREEIVHKASSSTSILGFLFLCYSSLDLTLLRLHFECDKLVSDLNLIS